MNVMAPKPIEMTEATVTLSRSDWEAHLDRLEEQSDRAAVARSMAERDRLGEAEFARLSYTMAETNRIIDDGVSRITIWRERAGVTQRALATEAGVSAGYLSEIEAGKKPGSVTALAAIAKVLRVPMEHLLG
jgi:DNA-binding XRE family transcriptional regulator